MRIFSIGIFTLNDNSKGMSLVSVFIVKIFSMLNDTISEDAIGYSSITKGWNLDLDDRVSYIVSNMLMRSVFNQK